MEDPRDAITRLAVSTTIQHDEQVRIGPGSGGPGDQGTKEDYSPDGLELLLCPARGVTELLDALRSIQVRGAGRTG